MCEKEKSKNGESTWADYPKSFLGWILWAVSSYSRKRWCWRIIISLAVILIAIVTGIGYCQLTLKRDLEIKKMLNKEKLDYWERSEDPEWRSALLKIWNKRGDVPEDIWTEYQDIKDPEVLIKIAAHPWIPDPVKEKLVFNDEPRVKISAILNRKDRDIAINKLAKFGDEDTKREVAKNQNTPTKTLEDLLAEDTNEKVKASVARNPSTTKETLKELEKDDCEDIRAGVAENQNTPPETLRNFLSLEKKYLAIGVAKNPEAPPDILKELSKYGIEEVREGVASNPKATFKILKRLAVDKSSKVRCKAISTIIDLPKNRWKYRSN